MGDIDWQAPQKKITAVCIIIAFVIGMLTGYYLITHHKPGDYSYLTNYELQDGIDVYRLCMQTSSRTGCKMSVNNFTVYHGLKREQGRREEERARLQAEADLALELER